MQRLCNKSFGSIGVDWLLIKMECKLRLCRRDAIPLGKVGSLYSMQKYHLDV